MKSFEYQTLLEYLLFIQPQISHLINVEDIDNCQREIEELERLAKIGKAFEDAKNKEFGIFEYVSYAGAKMDIYPITEYEYNKVLEWSEGER